MSKYQILIGKKYLTQSNELSLFNNFSIKFDTREQAKAYLNFYRKTHPFNTTARVVSIRYKGKKIKEATTMPLWKCLDNIPDIRSTHQSKKIRLY